MNPQQSSGMSSKASLSINFLIVGGGVAGLATALALRRVGHKVIVLEKGDGKSNKGRGGVRVPPNLSKVLFHWGLEDRLRQVAVTSKPIIFSKFDSGEPLGMQTWSDELIRETRGEFMLTTHGDIWQVLYDAAVSLGANVRYGAQVTEIDADNRTVILSTGEVLSGDVIIGADGERGLCRRMVLGRTERVVPTGVTMFDVAFNTERVTETMPADLLKMINIEDSPVFVAFGNGRATTGYPIRGGKDIAFHFFMRDAGCGGPFGGPLSTDLPRLISKPCDPRLWFVSQHADNVLHIAINQYEELEDWVHDSGHLVLVGHAAHPVIPGTIQGTSVAVEDGAVLAKLFAHLSDKEQVPSFLYAFQDLRRERCRDILQAEENLLQFLMLEDGPEQEARDRTMQAKYKAGRNVLDSEEGEEANGVESEQWREVSTIFGYDCEDEADDWWMQWGRLRLRAREAGSPNEVRNGGFDWGAVTMQVNETVTS